MRKGFTLLELIIVIVIVGILATLGFIKYSNQVEYSRITEAKVRLGLMRKYAMEYYFKNGSLTGVTLADLGVADGACHSTDYYYYSVEDVNLLFGGNPTNADLFARRCLSGAGGKSPAGTTAYSFYLKIYPSGGGVDRWGCFYPSDMSSCFGLDPAYGNP